MLNKLTLNKNKKIILQTIIEHSEVSQNEIAKLTDMNRSIVSKELSSLKDTNIIISKSDKNKNLIRFNHELYNTILVEMML